MGLLGLPGLLGAGDLRSQTHTGLKKNCPELYFSNYKLSVKERKSVSS